jgi:uncharacterized protein with PIN domain
MILDTSVILAIIQREPGWEHHSQTLQAAEHLLISAGTLQELLVGRQLGDCLRWSVDGEAGEGLNWRRAA